ncbi:MAG: hypothetical protein AAF730_06435 [Bacteroidota bacterium]
MTASRPIDIRKQRSFSDVLNVTFQFIKQVFKPLAKALLFICGPVMLLVSVSTGTAQFKILFASLNPEALANNANDFGEIAFAYLVIMIGSLVLAGLGAAVIFGAVRLYDAEGPEAVTFDALWDIVKRTFWRMLGTVVFIGVLMFVIYIGLLIPVVVVVGALAALVGGAGAILGGVIGVFAVLGILVLLLGILVLLTLLLPIRMNERVGVFSSLGRCRALLKGQLWPSLGILLVVWIIYTALGTILSLPPIIMAFVAGLHTASEAEPSGVLGAGLTAVTVVAGLASLLLYTIPLVAAAFQYYNLVEYKERAGLSARVAAMSMATAEAAAPFSESVQEQARPAYPQGDALADSDRPAQDGEADAGDDDSGQADDNGAEADEAEGEPTRDPA